MLNKRACLTTSLKASVCATALFAAGAAYAQAPSDADAVDAVVVTGSRVVRDGYAAPTPVSVVGRQEIERSATPNIADYVNTLPAVSGSSTPITTATNVGQNNAHLAFFFSQNRQPGGQRLQHDIINAQAGAFNAFYQIVNG